MIPAIYCETTELMKLSSLSLDPVAEQVQVHVNSQAVESIISKDGDLEENFPPFWPLPLPLPLPLVFLIVRVVLRVKVMQ